MNTLIIGDFNAHPFESTCIAADTLHAIPYIDELEEHNQSSAVKRFRKFYNPMWKLIGSEEKPYGTYYFYKTGVINYYWHIFDQVMIRPPLIDAFDEESLAIISKTANHRLLKGKRTNRKDYSDHLPLLCKLREAQNQLFFVLVVLCKK